MDPNPFGEFDQVRTNVPRDHLLKPAGPTDPEVCVIDVRTRRGRALGLIANYALHYVGGIPKVTEKDGRVVPVIFLEEVIRPLDLETLLDSVCRSELHILRKAKANCHIIEVTYYRVMLLAEYAAYSRITTDGRSNE